MPYVLALYPQTGAVLSGWEHRQPGNAQGLAPHEVGGVSRSTRRRSGVSTAASRTNGDGLEVGKEDDRYSEQISKAVRADAASLTAEQRASCSTSRIPSALVSYAAGSLEEAFEITLEEWVGDRFQHHSSRTVDGCDGANGFV